MQGDLEAGSREDTIQYFSSCIFYNLDTLFLKSSVLESHANKTLEVSFPLAFSMLLPTEASLTLFIALG